MTRLDLATFLPTDEDGRGDGEINPQVLSGSSVNTLFRCGKQWEYAYVLQLRRPPSIKQGLGIAAHDAIAKDLDQKVLTYRNLPAEEVEAEFEHAWDILAVDIEDVVEEVRIGKRGAPLKNKKETKAQAKESGLKAVVRFHENVSTNIQPLHVEQPIQFRIDGIEWSGIFDFDDDRGRVRDAKFTSKKPSDGGTYFVPMVGYALGYRQISDDPETETVLDYVVRTQDPYYLPLASGGPITDFQIDRFLRIIHTAKQSIDAGVFMPTGLQTHACGWCGYADICPDYRAANGGRNA